MAKTFCKEYHKAYYQKNKGKLDIVNKASSKTESYLAWKRAYMLEYNKKYTEANRGKYNAKAIKRHAAKLQRTPKRLSKDHLLEIEAIYTKASELTRSTGIRMNVDHIVPLQGKNVSGLHVPWNLQIITEKANNKKRNKFI